MKLRSTMPLSNLALMLALAACSNTSGRDPGPTSSIAAFVISEKDAALNAKDHAWLDVLANSGSLRVPAAVVGVSGTVLVPELSKIPSDVKSYLDGIDQQDKTSQAAAATPALKSDRRVNEPRTRTLLWILMDQASNEEISHYRQYLAALAKSPPSLPELDQSGLAFGEKNVALAAAWAAVGHYHEFDHGINGELDKSAQSDDLNRGLRVAYANYVSANDVLAAASDRIYAQEHPRELEKLRSGGQTTRVAAYEGHDAASGFFDKLADIYGADGDLRSAPVAELQADLKKVDESVEILKHSTENSAELEREKLDRVDVERLSAALSAFSVSAKASLLDITQGQGKRPLNDLLDKVNAQIKAFNALTR